MSALRQQDVMTLGGSISGALLEPGAPGYEEARQVWNGMFDRRPRLIAQCRSANDVAEAIRFARKHDLPLAVRGGGHNIAGTATCDDGLVVDLSSMRSVIVDAERRAAAVAGGCLLGDVDGATQAFGLATPLGINSTTGVGGLTLGGGFGWLSRKYGMTIDNLRSAEVVTAESEVLRASEASHPDLFWALRGGGGNFGVVTEFEFALHPVGPQVYAGLVVFPLAEAPAVLRQYRQLAEDAPEELSVWVIARNAPPLPFLPENVHGAPVVALAVCYVGAAEHATRLTDPIRGFGTVLGEHLGWQPYAMWQQVFDPLLTPGARNYWKSHNLEQLSDAAIDAIVAAASELPGAECEVFLAALGGATARVPVEATAYAGRRAAFVLNVHARWRDPHEDGQCVAWARRLFDEMKPHASSDAYVNFFTAEESDRVRAAYGPNFRRLAEVKRRYDPANVFRHNQNVPPA